MSSLLLSRRTFINTSASAVVFLSAPRLSFGQATNNRVEWQQFKTTSQYNSFLKAVRLMKANTNSASPSSWAYWTNIHLNYCPHGVAYFLAWHRGYLYHFERQLRLVSGDPTLTVPYWNYYKYPRIPAEFTDPTPGNPLYMPRTGTNVYNALSLTPFNSQIWNFQRGTINAFEPQIETAPHNQLHNLIGGEMANMTSPRDPIFYLHHAQIDRLFHAWALPEGKGIPNTYNPYNPATSDPYWAGNFTYAPGLTLPRYKAYYPGWLNFDYSDHTMPTTLPSMARANPDSPIKLVQSQGGSMLTRPAMGNFPATPARALAANKRSLGGVSGVVLADSHVSAHLPLAASSLQALQDAVGGAVNPLPQVPLGTFRSAVVVLEDLQVLGAGAKGGYFYNVYINLPFISDGEHARKYLLGTVGPFEVAGASHHGAVRLEYPATEALSQLSAYEMQEVTISMVRVNGENAPRGAVIKIGEARIELSGAAPWDPSPQSHGQTGQFYR